MPDNALKVNNECVTINRAACPVCNCAIQKLTSLYQDGKPYIKLVDAGTAQEDQRAQGFTIAAISTFSSLRDINFYDSRCITQQRLRNLAKTVNQELSMVYFNSILQSSGEARAQNKAISGASDRTIGNQVEKRGVREL